MANYLNTRFNLTFVQDTIKLAFVAPLNETIYINSNLFYIAACPISVDYVDLGEFDAGITTVNWSLCNTIGGGDRTTWIAAVLASIVVPNNAPTSLASPAATNSVVGYNGTTHQFTDLGNAPQQRFYAYATVGTVLGGGYPGNKVTYNVVVDDPISMYNVATNSATAPQAGFYIFGGTIYGGGANYIYLAVNGNTNDKIWGGGATGACNVTGGLWLNANDVVTVHSYGTANTTPFQRLNSFWGKRIV